jgi:type IV pilus assembly protein PilN
MIRINLLPQDERSSSRSIKLPSFAGLAPLAILPAVLVVVCVHAFLTQSKLSVLRTDVVEIQEEVRTIQPQVDRVKKLTAKREELERRLDVIRQLDEDRFLSVRWMDELSRHLPGYLWLTEASQIGPNQVRISGVTFSNLIVADMMMRLERSSMFSKIDLNQTERGVIDDREVITFSIAGRLTPDEDPVDFTADLVAPANTNEGSN